MPKLTDHKRHGQSQGKKNRKSRKPPNVAPGSLYVDPQAQDSLVRVIAYGPEDSVDHEIQDYGALRALTEKYPVVWVHVTGLGNERAISRIGEQFGLHRLALEDAVHPHQRPKLEDYRTNLFIVLRSIACTQAIESQQVGIFLGRNFVLTFQEAGGDGLEVICDRIKQNTARTRELGADYLVYSILDTFIDHYMPVIENFDEQLDALEEQVLLNAEDDAFHRIHLIKKQLMQMRRIILPLREVLSILYRDPNDLILDSTRPFLRDCYDHLNRTLDSIESNRELCSDLMQMYLSLTNNRMNEVMKVLTTIATVFLPLSFITGLYGMNFVSMPELNWKYGYLFAWFLIGCTTLGFMLYIRTFGWLKRSPRKRLDRRA